MVPTRISVSVTPRWVSAKAAAASNISDAAVSRRVATRPIVVPPVSAGEASAGATRPPSEGQQSGPWDHQEQVGVAGILTVRGKQRVRLAAMMRLVIEEVHHERALLSPHLHPRRAAEPHQIIGQPGIVHAIGPG